MATARLGWAARRQLVATTPWGTLLAGCGFGLAVSIAGYLHAHPSEPPGFISLTVRASFVPVVVAVAFLIADPQRSFTGTLPPPAWLPTAVRLFLALPVVAVTVTAQLELAAASIRIALPGQGGVGLPWLSFAGEAVAWLALALAAAASIARTRWTDVAGPTAAVVALTCLALATRIRANMLPSALVGLTANQRAGWAQAAWSWSAIAGLAILTACWASRDPWRRLRRPVSRGLSRPLAGSAADPALLPASGSARSRC